MHYFAINMNVSAAQKFAKLKAIQFTYENRKQGGLYYYLYLTD